MGMVRRCDKRCHSARGSRCRCWCGGFFHGSAGAVNRAALAQGMTELLEQHGFKEGETAYIEQKELPLEVA
jgi:glycine/D-amino acid oxidase-like deaminating enzyme